MSTDPKPEPTAPDELRPTPPPSDDTEFRTDEVRELVDRAQDGDVDSLNELFNRYHDHLVQLARKRLGARLRSKEEPDDLAQTAFREAARDFGQYEYRGETSLLRWLVRILQNKIRDKAEYYAAGKRDVSKERALEDTYPKSAENDSTRFEPPSDDLSVTRVVQRKEEFNVLRQALEQLSPDHRAAITHVFFQGLTLRQAGEKMGGRTEDAVRMLLRRAEAHLRELTKAQLG